MWRTVSLLLLLAFTSAHLAAQSPSGAGRLPLVVVLSFDQYRGDYVTRFAPVSGDRGFQRMMREGAWFSRCMYGHATTQTGPGHATLLTGCYAAKSGIVSNDLCLRDAHQCFYCARDSAGTVSPFLLMPPTVGDLLKQASPDSRVVGVALKDRAAVLMSGHHPDAVVFLDYGIGRFTTSSVYPQPAWLPALADSFSMARYAGRVWESKVPMSAKPAQDDQPWEGTFSDNSKLFPHRISDVSIEKTTGDATMSPFSLEALLGAAMYAMRAEKLGADSVPDLLVIGASTTDHLGHAFGPDSREVQELYIAADAMVAELIDSLDSRVGRDRYQLFVCSDHGVAPIPEAILAARKPGDSPVDAGRIPYNVCKDRVVNALNSRFGKPPYPWIWEVHLPHVYLDERALKWTRSTMAEVTATAIKALQTVEGVGIVTTPQDLMNGVCPPGTSAAVCALLKNDVNLQRAGDLIVYPRENWIFGSNPATHGTPWDYDRWVPLLVLGGGVAAQTIGVEVGPADIAPTIARIWGLELNGTDGVPLPLMQELPIGAGR